MRALKTIAASVLGIVIFAELGMARHYATRFCEDPRFDCVRIQSGQSWASLWPDPHQRDLMKRLNRMNTPLYPGMVIAVPKGLHRLDVMDISPFRPYIKPIGKKTIIVDQKRMAWGAYNSSGELVRWGPMSGGQSWCADVKRGCRTASGHFQVYDKRGAGCKSSKYPLGRGGAPMPYCMFFHGGYALHGSPVVPGYHASHGCVRLFNEDAEWLHQQFVDIPGTRVIVESL